jgi:hypothetical protein
MEDQRLQAQQAGHAPSPFPDVVVSIKDASDVKRDSLAVPKQGTPTYLQRKLDEADHRSLYGTPASGADSTPDMGVTPNTDSITASHRSETSRESTLQGLANGHDQHSTAAAINNVSDQTPYKVVLQSEQTDISQSVSSIVASLAVPLLARHQSNINNGNVPTEGITYNIEASIKITPSSASGTTQPLQPTSSQAASLVSHPCFFASVVVGRDKRWSMM